MDADKSKVRSEWQGIQATHFWEEFWKYVNKIISAEEAKLLNKGNSRDEDMFLKGASYMGRRITNNIGDITKKITGE